MDPQKICPIDIDSSVPFGSIMLETLIVNVHLVLASWLFSTELLFCTFLFL